MEGVGFHQGASSCSLELSGPAKAIASRLGVARGLAIGRSPCKLRPRGGWGFAVVVRAVDLEHFPSGLWVGLTATPPHELVGYDFAADVPGTCVAGGEGVLWDGEECHEVQWNTGELRVDDEVSVSLTDLGEFFVRVNGELQASTAQAWSVISTTFPSFAVYSPSLKLLHRPSLTKALLPLDGRPLFPIVELRGTTQAVQLLAHSSFVEEALPLPMVATPSSSSRSSLHPHKEWSAQEEETVTGWEQRDSRRGQHDYARTTPKQSSLQVTTASAPATAAPAGSSPSSRRRGSRGSQLHGVTGGASAAPAAPPAIPSAASGRRAGGHDECPSRSMLALQLSQQEVRPQAHASRATPPLAFGRRASVAAAGAGLDVWGFVQRVLAKPSAYDEDVQMLVRELVALQARHEAAERGVEEAKRETLLAANEAKRREAEMRQLRDDLKSQAAKLQSAYTSNEDLARRMAEMQAAKTQAQQRVRELQEELRREKQRSSSRSGVLADRIVETLQFAEEATNATGRVSDSKALQRLKSFEETLACALMEVRRGIAAADTCAEASAGVALEEADWPASEHVEIPAGYGRGVHAAQPPHQQQHLPGRALSAEPAQSSSPYSKQLQRSPGPQAPRQIMQRSSSASPSKPIAAVTPTPSLDAFLPGGGAERAAAHRRSSESPPPSKKLLGTTLPTNAAASPAAARRPPVRAAALQASPSSQGVVAARCQGQGTSRRQKLVSEARSARSAASLASADESTACSSSRSAQPSPLPQRSSQRSCRQAVSAKEILEETQSGALEVGGPSHGCDYTFDFIAAHSFDLQARGVGEDINYGESLDHFASSSWA